MANDTPNAFTRREWKALSVRGCDDSVWAAIALLLEAHPQAFTYTMVEAIRQCAVLVEQRASDEPAAELLVSEANRAADVIESLMRPSF